jgi:hypothetical protein
MKRLFPVLAVLAGLGSSISFTQVKHQSDPFSRYLTGLKSNQPEATLVRFAGECGVDVSRIQPRYAIGAGSSLEPVKSLAQGLRQLETDFYSTAEVRRSGERVLVEIWANSDDVGSEVRYYECFLNGKLVQAEVVNWNVPVDKGDPKAWGYSQRWECVGNGKLLRTKTEFVDGGERFIPKPKLDAEDEKSLLGTPFLGSLDDWKLPPSALR